MAMIARLVLPLVLVQMVACTGPSGLGVYFEPDIYTVRRGDTLYSIAWKYQLDHEDLIRWNGLASPYRIQPGQKLRLAAAPPQPGPAETDSVAAPPVEHKITPIAAGSASKTPEPMAIATPIVDTAPKAWVWPVEGPLLRTFAASDPARKGLDIGGRVGQPIIASSAGRIVYSGNGLPAYGNLLIVRHDDVYLSAYAHNRELLVKEGESVDQGQPIAYMGLDEDGKPLLHFEIRRNGRPVDPLAILPKR